MRLRPECCSREHGIDIELLPPNPLVAALVQFTMMGTAEGHGKFVAHLAPKGASLGELEMVRIRRAAPASQAGLRAYKFQMFRVPESQRFADRG